MNILLIQPPIRDFYRTQLRTQPLGLACLAAALRQNGHQASILDCQTPAQRPIAVPEKLHYLQEHYVPGDQTPFRLYNRFYSFGMQPEEIRSRIAAARPDAVGLQFQLDILEPGTAATFDAEIGVNNTYIFVEGVFDWVNNFGGDGFNLSDNSFLAGLMLEF